MAVIEGALNNNIEQYGYTAKVGYETISSGSFLSSREYECLKVYNSAHPTDYFYFCILLSKERVSDVVSVFLAGKSTQLKMDDYLKNTKAQELIGGTLNPTE